MLQSSLQPRFRAPTQCSQLAISTFSSHSSGRPKTHRKENRRPTPRSPAGVHLASQQTLNKRLGPPYSSAALLPATLSAKSQYYHDGKQNHSRTRERDPESPRREDPELREKKLHLGDPLMPPKKPDSILKERPKKKRGRGRESNYESENREEKKFFDQRTPRRKYTHCKNAPATLPPFFIMHFERPSTVGSLHSPPLIDFILHWSLRSPYLSFSNDCFPQTFSVALFPHYRPTVKISEFSDPI